MNSSHIFEIVGQGGLEVHNRLQLFIKWIVVGAIRYRLVFFNINFL